MEGPLGELCKNPVPEHHLQDSDLIGLKWGRELHLKKSPHVCSPGMASVGRAPQPWERPGGAGCLTEESTGPVVVGEGPGWSCGGRAVGSFMKRDLGALLPPLHS